MDMAFLSLSAGMARLGLIGKDLIVAAGARARLFSDSGAVRVAGRLER
jgi:hypothetical protein